MVASLPGYLRYCTEKVLMPKNKKIYTRKRHNPFIVPETVTKVTGTKGCRGDHRPRQWHKMSFTNEKVTQRTSLRGGVLRFCLNTVEIICVRTISVQKVVLRHLCICFAISRVCLMSNREKSYETAARSTFALCSII